MPNTNNGSSDVAMFIDWENMHGFINTKANLSALREVAQSHGRLVFAKAYADWREQRFQSDSLLLYQAGVEPVYVPNGFKNNVDVKLATDCIDCAYKNPHIGIFVLVTGDGDFIHVATTLRPLGKKVIVIAQSNNASNRLGDLVDTLLLYDRDVVPQEKEIPTTIAPPKKVDEVHVQIVEMLKGEKGIPILAPQVKERLTRKYGMFDQKAFGFPKFKALLEDGHSKGYYMLNTAGLRDWVTLPHKNTSTPDLPLAVDDVYKTIVEFLRESGQRQVLLPAVKHALMERYGGFDESVYGYNQFKEFMRAGEEFGYFKMGLSDKNALCVERPDSDKILQQYC